jgi:polysaccharide biosynthesis protein PslH
VDALFAARAPLAAEPTENILPYVASANIFVFPMFEGSGLQNKILEAMFAGVPVVTTSIPPRQLGRNKR